MCSAARGGGGQLDGQGASTKPRTPTSKNSLRQRVKPSNAYHHSGVARGAGGARPDNSLLVGRSTTSTSSPTSRICNISNSTATNTTATTTSQTTTPRSTDKTTSTRTKKRNTSVNGQNTLIGKTTTTSSSSSSTSYSHSSSSSSSSSSGNRSSCCGMWMKGLQANPRGLLLWPLSVHILLLTLCYCRYASAEDRLNLIHARLVNMLRTKQSLFYRRQLRSGMTPALDLRNHRLFISNPKLDCCPTVTELEQRRTGINPSGLVLELYSNQNFTQSFYETICYPFLRNRPCQFVDPKLAYATRCVQQYSYVYAIGRTYGSSEGFRVDYIRIPAGCKCQIQKQFIRRRKKNVIQ